VRVFCMMSFILITLGDCLDLRRMPGGDLGDKIREAFDDGKEISVSVIAAMGEEQVIAFRLEKS